MTDGIEKFIRIDMSRFGAYSACKSPDVIARKLGIPEDEIIKLDANENPYGCSPKVRSALKKYPYFHIYPDSAQTELLEDISKYVGVGKEYIVAGNGSDELIDLLSAPSGLSRRRGYNHSPYLRYVSLLYPGLLRQSR